MTIPTLPQAMTYLRQIDADMGAQISLAIASAQAELDSFIGGDSSAERWPTESDVPGDVLAAALLLVKVHIEEPDPEKAELWRGSAQGLLTKYRIDSGMRAA